MYRAIATALGLLLGLATAGLPQAGAAGPPMIRVEPLSAAPVVDGDASDWKDVAAQEIPVTGPLAIASVAVKAGTHGERVYFLFRWPDPQADTEHKPFVWDATSGRYVKGPQVEDRFAMQLAMDGDFDVDWFSGKSFTADMWHWKAARSNPHGLAQDKMTIIGLEPVRKAYKAQTADGRDLYIQRPSDAGDKLYTTRRYRRFEGETVPKYILSSSVSGSVADVSAKGVWQDGYWTLELSRKLDTGHDDDVRLAPGMTLPGGIAVFERSMHGHHNISETLLFELVE